MTACHDLPRQNSAEGAVASRITGRPGEPANTDNRAAAPLTQLLELTSGPETVIREEFAIPGAERVLIFGSWAERYPGNQERSPTTLTSSGARRTPC
jgi:hypothetical protein